jgi:mRNA interferase MazF
MIQQRDLVLVPFPFSDQSGRKVRPVITLSNNEFNECSEDVIVVGVTSNISKDKYSVKLSDEDLEEGKLITNCVVKVENILKIDRHLIIKKIGKIQNEKLKIILKVLNVIFEAKN